MALADPANGLGISYHSNHMSLYGLTHDPRYVGLTKAVYESLQQITQKT